MEDFELKAIRLQLKQILKNQKLSYSELARRMDISEITVKRFFTSEDISFSKLQQICQVLGTSAVQLISLVNTAAEKSFQLTPQQEAVLSENENLYNFFILLLKYKSLKAVALKSRLKKEVFPKYLKELEKLGLAEIPLGDRVPLKQSGALTWLKGGPLQKKFMRATHLRYLDVFESSEAAVDSYLTSSHATLRPESMSEMKRDLEFIANKYRGRASQEESVYPEEKLVEVAWLFGVGRYRS